MDMVSSPLQSTAGSSSRFEVMHLLWKVRFVRRSRLPKEFEQDHPENLLLP